MLLADDAPSNKLSALEEAGVPADDVPSNKSSALEQALACNVPWDKSSALEEAGMSADDAPSDKSSALEEAGVPADDMPLDKPSAVEEAPEHGVPWDKSSAPEEAETVLLANDVLSDKSSALEQAGCRCQTMCHWKGQQVFQVMDNSLCHWTF